MLVDLALTLLLTPRPEEGITRDVIKMRNKVTDTAINIVMDALLCCIDTHQQRCNKLTQNLEAACCKTELYSDLTSRQFISDRVCSFKSPITNRDFHFKMENFPNMVVTMVHFFLQQLETFSTLGIKFNFRYIGVLHP